MAVTFVEQPLALPGPAKHIRLAITNLDTFLQSLEFQLFGIQPGAAGGNRCIGHIYQRISKTQLLALQQY